MFAPILEWVLGRPRAVTSPPALESFGAARLDRTLGEEILEATPERRASRDAIRSALLGIELAERREMIDRVLARFALYVWDLPASESNHHARPFGLFDHSLEVARGAAQELARPSFRVSEDPAANFREHPLWAYAGFLLGLLHDVGKLLEVEVFSPGEKEKWDPLLEPLLSFLRRHGRRESGDATLRWMRGRGMNRHAWSGRGLVPLVLPPPPLSYLGPRLSVLLGTFIRSYEADRKEWERGPAGRVVATVRRWDRELSKEGGHPPGLEEPDEVALAGAPSGAEAEKPAELPLMVPEPAADDAPIEPCAEASAETTQDAPAPSRSPEPWVQAELPLPIASDDPAAPDERTRVPEETPLGPSAQDLKLASALEPREFLEKLRRAVVNGILRLGGVRSEAFLCRSHLWLTWPDAFVSLLEWSDKIAYQASQNEQILGALRQLPILAPSESGSPLHRVMLHPKADRPKLMVRLRLEGFMSADELSPLKRWEHEILPAPVRRWATPGGTRDAGPAIRKRGA